jgi:hypothetical protein
MGAVEQFEIMAARRDWLSDQERASEKADPQNEQPRTRQNQLSAKSEHTQDI